MEEQRGVALKTKAHLIKIDWQLLREYEKDDNTTGGQEIACVSGSCEI